MSFRWFRESVVAVVVVVAVGENVKIPRDKQANCWRSGFVRVAVPSGATDVAAQLRQRRRPARSTGDGWANHRKVSLAAASGF